jgi:RNA polymerase sigma-70 factor, ECF subfamily
MVAPLGATAARTGLRLALRQGRRPLSRRASGGPDPVTAGLPPTTLFVLGARSGDRAAFEHLVRASYDRLYGLARRIVVDPSDAEDATQETFLRAWRELPRLREPERFEAWLTRMLVHGCYDLLRRRRRREAKVAWIIREPAASETIAIEERERLGEAFGRLSPEHRAVLALHFFRELTAAEIAGLLEVPEGTINSRLYYGTRALRAALEAIDRAPARTGEQTA